MTPTDTYYTDDRGVRIQHCTAAFGIPTLKFEKQLCQTTKEVVVNESCDTTVPYHSVDKSGLQCAVFSFNQCFLMIAVEGKCVGGIIVRLFP